jgi:hypothetical protein
MSDPVSFNARAVFTFSPDRIYRVECRNSCLYFLRIGGQFDSDRLGPPPGGGLLPAVMMLAASKALSHKHEKAQLIARDPGKDPEELLTIHPDNFKLLPSEIKSATFLPKKWFPSHGAHVGRLVIEPLQGKSQEYQFEKIADLRTALEHLTALLGGKLVNQI